MAATIKIYNVSTILFTFYFLYSLYSKEKQFFIISMYSVKSKFHLCVILNLFLMIIINVGNFFIHLFFGEIVLRDLMVYIFLIIGNYRKNKNEIDNISPILFNISACNRYFENNFNFFVFLCFFYNLADIQTLCFSYRNKNIYFFPLLEVALFIRFYRCG